MTGRTLGKWAIWGLIGYFIISIATFPFLDSLWLGELPVLAIIQFPKIEPAKFVRVEVVMPALKWMGFSKESFSPDYGTAGPYGLLMAYLAPALGILMYARASKDERRTAKETLFFVLVFVLLCTDYVCTMIFATGPGLTIY